ncbi:MAG: DUF4340 domain-containing protein [Proteobacteria bacterium]|jgi:hypothetical protein|nr:DUF4340 domain-containing protein [Pseudomonadota bacterium]
MSKTNLGLIVLFFAQLALVAFAWWPRSSGITEATPFIGIMKGDIDKVVIVGTTGEEEQRDPVELQKKGGAWVIASAGDYPADETKVDELLGNLTELKIRKPVATQTTSHPALKVADNEFGKKLDVSGGGKDVSFFLGAAAANTVHLRRVGANEVYSSRGISEWSIRDVPNSYVDTTYIDIDKDTIDSVIVQNTNGRFSFVKEGGVWSLDTLTEEDEFNADEMKTLLGKVAKIRLRTPIGEPLPAHGLDTGISVTFTFTQDEQTEASGFIIGNQTDDGYYVQANNNPYVVEVSTYSVKKLVEMEAADFIAEPEEEEE